MLENIREVCLLDFTADFGVATIRRLTLQISTGREKIDLFVVIPNEQ